MESQSLEFLEKQMDILYLAFGLLRQSIWKVEPRMKRVMLSSHT
jgi:hypothetical protein